jgi:predicted  nucleic acid-binding Zn-ribbon protein
MKLPLLYELQGIEKELQAIERRLAEQHGSKDLKRLKEEYNRLTEEYQKGEVRIRNNTYRQEVRSNEIKNLDYNIKAAKEIKFSRETDTVKKLENIDKQLETLEAKKQTAENDIITLIDEADNINKELLDIKKRQAFIKKKYMSCKEVLNKSLEELTSQKSELSLKIEEMKKSLDKESLEMYDRLTKAHSDPVALVENRKCCGCNMEVPAMDYEALKSGSCDLRCQSCGRLLLRMQQAVLENK